MDLQIDSREHKKELERITSQFDRIEGINYFVSKLYVGDYQNLDNPRLIIDRKKDLLEVCQNVCQGHERFRKELLRAERCGISLIILIEQAGIKTLEDVYFWQNPRRTKVQWKTVNGKKIRYQTTTKATDGKTLYKTLKTIQDRYNVRFEFCNKKETGRKIVELLERDSN